MMRIGLNTSVIEIYRNGMIDTKTMNICRKNDINCVGDMVRIGKRYGSLLKKFGPKSKAAMAMQVLVDLAA